MPAHGSPEESIDVSVLVPAHNESSRIKQFLGELLAFTRDFNHKNGTTFEIIVAEDGSTDNTLQFVKRFNPTTISIRGKEEDSAKRLV